MVSTLIYSFIIFILLHFSVYKIKISSLIFTSRIIQYEAIRKSISFVFQEQKYYIDDNFLKVVLIIKINKFWFYLEQKSEFCQQSWKLTTCVSVYQKYVLIWTSNTKTDCKTNFHTFISCYHDGPYQIVQKNKW